MAPAGLETNHPQLIGAIKGYRRYYLYYIVVSGCLIDKGLAFIRHNAVTLSVTATADNANSETADIASMFISVFPVMS